MATSTNQTLRPFYAGEDVVYTFTGTSPTDPTGWAVRFTLAAPVGTPLLTVTSPTITRAVTGAYTCVFSVPLTHSQTATLPTGPLSWQLDRTDPGNEQVLASGAAGTGGVEVLAPVVGLP